MQSYLACGSTVPVWVYVIAKSSSTCSMCFDISEIKTDKQTHDQLTLLFMITFHYYNDRTRPTGNTTVLFYIPWYLYCVMKFPVQNNMTFPPYIIINTWYYHGCDSIRFVPVSLFSFSTNNTEESLSVIDSSSSSSSLKIMIGMFSSILQNTTDDESRRS